MPAVSLSDDEALVLFELLAREINNRNHKRVAEVIEHPAEFWVLDGILGRLERELVEPFKADYSELLSAARERVLDARDQDRTYVVGEV
jgi:hypothetical protein